jgi:hypothetical protein
MREEYRFVSCCGKYYCALCDYHRGIIVEAARELLYFTEEYGSLRLIVESSNACNYDEFMKGLKYIASHDKPCKGCRLGGGWSWWPDCPVRDCTIQKGIDFCYQCEDFPCHRLKTEPLLERKKAMIEVNNRIKALGIEEYFRQLRERYKQSISCRSQNF